MAKLGQDFESERKRRLGYELTQAVLRLEPQTVAHLARQGAEFTHDTLCAAIATRYAGVVDHCLAIGVAPDIDAMTLAVHMKDTDIFNSLVRKFGVTEELHGTVAALGTEEMRKSLAQRPALPAKAHSARLHS